MYLFCGVVAFQASEKEGYHYFNSMDNDYGIPPTCVHFVCMVMRLVQVGILEQANLIDVMPFKPMLPF